MKNTGRKTVKGRAISAPMLAKASTVKISSATPTVEEIAKRSYELFLENGGEHGHHEEHWLQAERELTSR
ncbi:MAG: DUF2934 domain-containing protein [Myxococcales bacterium]